jgi:acyl-CoA synthetase (AMP-forming)/AMP-acid ligase II
VFSCYLNRPAATAEAFDQEGWFRTGDVAVREGGSYRLLGRSSVDIIKSAGYKLSALEIEREILAHPQVAEAAVVGRREEVMGEVVVAVVVLRPPLPTSSDTSSDGSSSNSGGSDSGSAAIPTNNVFLATQLVREFLSTRLAHYKQPQQVFVVDALPRNHLGKVNKKQLMSELQLL